ncbi:MAG: hypothetical protein MJA27_06545 [Pseudanabaenales cyanobacterium]|nr:hypothetical protein [Pseudanabaenales cyanobacterium]
MDPKRAIQQAANIRDGLITGEVIELCQPLSRSGRLPASTRQQIAYLPQQFLLDQLIPITVEDDH